MNFFFFFSLIAKIIHSKNATAIYSIIIYLVLITTISSAMSAIVRQRDDFYPIQRNRSSSANEASKPILMLQRRQTHVGTKPFNFSPSAGKFFFLHFPKSPLTAELSILYKKKYAQLSFVFLWFTLTRKDNPN